MRGPIPEDAAAEVSDVPAASELEHRDFDDGVHGAEQLPQAPAEAAPAESGAPMAEEPSSAPQEPVTETASPSAPEVSSPLPEQAEIEQAKLPMQNLEGASTPDQANLPKPLPNHSRPRKLPSDRAQLKKRVARRRPAPSQEVAETVSAGETSAASQSEMIPFPRIAPVVELDSIALKRQRVTQPEDPCAATPAQMADLSRGLSKSPRKPDTAAVAGCPQNPQLPLYRADGRKIVSQLDLSAPVEAEGFNSLIAQDKGQANASVLPKTGSLTLTALSDSAAAEDFANQLIAEYRARQAGSQESAPLVLVHLGDVPPKPLRWVMLKLNAAQIPHRLVMITQSDLQAEFDTAEKNAERMIVFGSPEDAPEYQQKVRSTFQKSRLFAKQLFGMPEGLTLWFFDLPALGLRKSLIKRSTEERRLELRNATVAGMMTGGSMLATLYVKNPQLFQNPEQFLVNFAALPAFMGWVWLWAYQARPWGAIMAQGKAIKEAAAGKWKVANSDVSFYLFQFSRGLVTNSIAMSVLLGPSSLGIKALPAIALNSMVNLFARTWVDKWIVDRQATIQKDGTVIRQEGQHAPKTTIRIRFAWEFGYGLFKNLQLIGFSHVIDVAYVVMGVIGISKKLQNEKHAITRAANGAAEKLGLRSGTAKPAAVSDPCELMMMAL